MACANVNCSLDYSLGEITAIMLCCIDEEAIFSEKSPLNDPIRHQMVNLTPANYAAMLSHTWLHDNNQQYWVVSRDLLTRIRLKNQISKQGDWNIIKRF